MGLVYLGGLLLSLAAMLALDWRLRLFLFRSPCRAALVLACGLLFFLIWDVAGIRLGIFYRAETAIMTGILLAPDLPLEEAFFLTFLCYLTMVLFTTSLRWAESGTFWPPARSSAGTGNRPKEDLS
ncbi:lycopene cyclase domain-containing protein [Paeniglutamicibacter antarcticus]|uniref:Lycopene cyclase domain-containing protein n=1 Tax=Arthrobacter terrae TaxID=2935737 RepID=A0A931GAX8_9MICC|nr:lycopene cyclase domain-containing protein [Arthrobacter terrae]MBG0740187.1 lycopene cyclase domain-containing protein [Arthrobacter terrae]